MTDIEHDRLAFGSHWFGCTSGADSSCGGALTMRERLVWERLQPRCSCFALTAKSIATEVAPTGAKPANMAVNATTAIERVRT
jgi:hypothetical protein